MNVKETYKKVEIKNYTKVLKGKNVLEQINLSMEKGKIYGIQGHNGCGKTMLLRAISGLIKATEGEVVIDGKILRKEIDFPPSIGVLIENPEFWKQYTGIQVLQTLARIKGEIHKEEIVESMKRVGLLDKKDIVVGKYSLGMRQRLGIAQAIMEKPEILLFDEPTNALDREGVSLFLEIIKEEKKRGALIVIVSHDPNTLLDICDEIITMENGKVIEQGEAVNEKN